MDNYYQLSYLKGYNEAKGLVWYTKKQFFQQSQLMKPPLKITDAKYSYRINYTNYKYVYAIGWANTLNEIKCEIKEALSRNNGQNIVQVQIYVRLKGKEKELIKEYVIEEQ